MEWFYANENDEQIPIAESELETLTRDGIVKPTTLVWNESLPDWLECQRIKPELFSQQSASAMPSEAGVQQAPLNYEITAPGQPPRLDPRQVQGPADGMATGSMVCGIVGLVMSFCYGIGFPVCIVAIVLGHLGRKKLREANLPVENGQLMAGLVLGWIGVGFFLIGVIFAILYFVVFAAAIATGAAAQ